MKKETENWLNIAKYDLKAAKGNFKIGFYLKTIENCHSSLEKLLKGIIFETKLKQPPKIHDLLALVSFTMLKEIKDEVKTTLDELNDIYFKARYPDDFYEITTYLSKNKVKNIYNKTERIFKWLEKKLDYQ